MTVVPQISLLCNRQLALVTVDHQIKWLHNVSSLFFSIKKDDNYFLQLKLNEKWQN